MSARKSQAIALPSGDEEFLFAMEINALIALPLVFKATIELGILEIMAKSGPTLRFCLLRLPPVSPQAPDTWDRILHLLSSCSILSCILAQDTEGNPLRLYGLGPKTKHFVRAHGTATFAAPLLLMHTDKIVTRGWYCLKEDIMEGGDTFKLAIGLHVFWYTNKSKRCNAIFNNAMQSPTNMYMSKIVESYRGFDNVKTVVNIGGVVGANTPLIHGINFDLHHVVKEALPYPGIEHVGGDTTNYIPKVDVILMKWIIHVADDKLCVKPLKICWEVEIVDAVLPEYPETAIITRNAFLVRMAVLNITPGGKDRTEREFKVLARASGFNAPKLVCPAYIMWVVKLHKDVISSHHRQMARFQPLYCQSVPTAFPRKFCVCSCRLCRLESGP